MKRVLRWAGKTLGTALVLTLVIVLLPYARDLLGRLLPDITGRTATVSALLSHHLSESARLETLTVEDEGVFTATQDALLLGTVQTVTVHYTYRASLGIDLTKVTVTPTGNAVTLTLPETELLSDSLTPTRVDRDDFWYPLTEKRRAAILAEEQTRCRDRVLAEALENNTGRAAAEKALRETVAGWMEGTGSVPVIIAWEEDAEPST